MTNPSGRVVPLRQWYALTGAGRSAVRVTHRMSVGSGELGELSLDPVHPLLVIYREGFGLRLDCVDRDMEFEDRWDGKRSPSVDVGPGCRAEVALLDTSLTLDTTLAPSDMRQNLYFSLVPRKRLLPLPKAAERRLLSRSEPGLQRHLDDDMLVIPVKRWMLAPVIGIALGYLLWTQVDTSEPEPAPSIVGGPIEPSQWIAPAQALDPMTLSALVDGRLADLRPALDWMRADPEVDAACLSPLPNWTLLHEIAITEILPTVVKRPEPQPPPEPRRVARRPAPVEPEPTPEPVVVVPDPEPEIDLSDYPFDQLTVTRRVQARYPRRAPAGAEGSVELRLVISDRGRVKSAEVVGAAPSYFRSAALRAAKRWRFEPVQVDGDRVEVTTRIRFLFVSD